MRWLLGIVLALVLAAPASAHVSVLPDVARPGDTVELTFRVPNERPNSSTTGVELFLPAGVPAKVAPHEGWTVDEKGGGDVAFTADSADAAIAGGRTQDFKVTLGPLPQADRVVVKALQTYADGQVIRWIQDTGDDDERPAAILDLSGKGSSADGGSAALIIVVIAIPLLALAVLGWLVTRRRRRDI